MSPVNKEEAQEQLKQALQAPQNATLVENLQKRGMSMENLMAKPELKRMAEQSPPDLKDKVHDFLQQQLKARESEQKPQKLPSEKETSTFDRGHGRA